MVLQRKKLVLGGAILVLLLLLVAFGLIKYAGSSGNTTGSSGDTKSSSTENQESRLYGAPRLITPTSVGGSNGHGPIVISSPTPVPGGQPGSQQVVLSDRTLIIQSVTKQTEPGAGSTAVSLNLTIQNTSSNAIMNKLPFFQLVGPGGDVFGYQYNSSDTFYGPIPAHTTRTGTIIFQVPTAALSGLRLMYRPEVATETALIALKIS